MLRAPRNLEISSSMAFPVLSGFHLCPIQLTIFPGLGNPKIGEESYTFYPLEPPVSNDTVTLPRTFHQSSLCKVLGQREGLGRQPPRKPRRTAEQGDHGGGGESGASLNRSTDQSLTLAPYDESSLGTLLQPPALETPGDCRDHPLAGGQRAHRSCLSVYMHQRMKGNQQQVT